MQFPIAPTLPFRHSSKLENATRQKQCMSYSIDPNAKWSLRLVSTFRCNGWRVFKWYKEVNCKQCLESHMKFSATECWIQCYCALNTDQIYDRCNFRLTRFVPQCIIQRAIIRIYNDSYKVNAKYPCSWAQSLHGLRGSQVVWPRR